MPKSALQPRLPYLEDFTQGQMRAIGAAGPAITMIVAGVVHLRRKENFAINLVLLAMAVIVAVGRF
ncbi:hypothetical protein [Nonomuraea sediminis]|uniref:hypothetical protein n=1 Tax=Nonomuraea sediminis TaxID=2835864 RepID=UPI001BDD5D28|nr:hypothetical protein [Nonomuraea sediminis]